MNSPRASITWLDQLGPCNEDQPTKLFGMALFNFNPELAALIKQVTHNFSTTGTLDDQGREGDGGASVLSPSSAGDATSLGSRTSEIKAVLDLEAVRNSRLYKTMSNTAQRSMTTLVNVANNQAKDAWHGLSAVLLPAMKQQAALTLAVPQVLISTEISSATQLVFNPTYSRDYQVWSMELVTLQKKINGDKRPKQIIAKASGSARLNANLAQISGWLGNLGRAK